MSGTEAEPFVAIVDHGMGNLYSVAMACRHVGISSRITTDPTDIDQASLVILPGVGAYPRAMERLASLNLVQAITRHVEQGRPLVGICLGLQLLFEQSEEFGQTKGLGLIPGRVKKFDFSKIENPPPIPHIGWNNITGKRSLWDCSLLRRNRLDDSVYFVHSYVIEPEDTSIVLATTRYGSIDFPSVVRLDNITAFQFHPEKSGENGLCIYSEIAEAIRV